jgi:Tfp pilus assembly PilM family ATPase
MVTIPDSMVRIHYVDLERFSDFTPAERSYTLWRIRNLLPAAYREGWIIDYQLLTTVERDETRLFRLMVLSSRESDINPLATLLDGMDLRPIGFLSQVLASLNAAHEHLSQGPGPYLILRIGTSGTSLAFIRSGLLEYHRFFPTGMSEMVTLMAKRFKAAPEQVEELMMKGLVTGGMRREDAPSWFSVGEAFDTLLPFLRELVVTRDHYIASQSSPPLAVAYLMGKGAQVPGLVALIEDLLGTPVRDLGKVLAPIPGVGEGELQRYAASLGAARVPQMSSREVIA